MKTKHLRPKAIYQGTTQRIITMIADGYVFYTVVRQGWKKFKRKSSHCTIKKFMDWCDSEITFEGGQRRWSKS